MVTGLVALTRCESAGSVCVRSRANVADPLLSAPGRLASAVESERLSDESASAVTRAWLIRSVSCGARLSTAPSARSVWVTN